MYVKQKKKNEKRERKKKKIARKNDENPVEFFFHHESRKLLSFRLLLSARNTADEKDHIPFYLNVSFVFSMKIFYAHIILHSSDR